MKITIDRNVVEVSPDDAQETSSLETLWRILIDCVGDAKKLTPIGEYIPSKANLARFTIEGVAGGKTVMSEEKALEAGTYICTTCNKYINVKSGDEIPFCCSVIMEAVD